MNEPSHIFHLIIHPTTQQKIKKITHTHVVSGERQDMSTDSFNNFYNQILNSQNESHRQKGNKKAMCMGISCN